MTLQAIGTETGTDKADQAHAFHGKTYLEYYEPRLKDLRGISGNILEIGVLTGASLKMWKKFFGESKVVGIDIDTSRSKLALGENVFVRIGSQADQQFLHTVAHEFGPFKLIVDDGSHIVKHMLGSFKYLWPHLAAGGWYIMEDMRISYYGVDQGWPGMTYNSTEDMRLPNDRSVFNEFLLGTCAEIDNLRGDVDEIHLLPMVVMLKKVLR